MSVPAMEPLFTGIANSPFQMPSPQYDSYLPVFEEAFQSGIAPYTQSTGLQLYRLITGRTLSEIKPFFATDAPYRGTYSGASGIFAAERPDLTSAEVLGSLGFDNAPTPSYLIHYQFSGSGTFLDRVENPIFQEKYLSISGKEKHEFSQDCRYYMESMDYMDETYALVWNSASGSALSAPGLTYMVLPPFSGALRFTDCEPIA